MRSAVCTVLLFFGVISFAEPPAPIQPIPLPVAPKLEAGKAPEAKAVVKHHRGRKAPKNEKALIAASWERHKHHLQAMAHVTASSYDARTLGIINTAWDQAQCGSCWNFSGTRVCNTALIKAGQLTLQQTLSTQYTMDCYQNGGCDGDDNTTVTAQAKSHGLPLTSDYGPYTASSGRCNTGSMKYYQIADTGYVGPSDGVTATQDIKDAIVKYGIVGCAVAAGDDWDNITTGTIVGKSTSIDHDVTLIGCDDNHDNGDGSKGAWLMMNSWGTSWGIQGVGWIKYGADSIGTSSIWAVAVGGPVPPPPPGPTPNPPTPGPTPNPPTPGPVSPSTISIDAGAKTVTVSSDWTVNGVTPANSVDLTGVDPEVGAAIRIIIAAEKAKKSKSIPAPAPMPIGPKAERRLDIFDRMFAAFSTY